MGIVGLSGGAARWQGTRTLLRGALVDGNNGPAVAREHVQGMEGARIALPLSRPARQRRSLEDRVDDPFSGRFRVVSGATMRLSLRSRFRRALVARRIVQTYAAVNRRDFEVILTGFDPELEYRPSIELMPPDLEAVSHGTTGSAGSGATGWTPSRTCGGTLRRFSTSATGSL
jgi:hypothetical protein